MARKCKAFAHLDDAYYPEYNCISTGTEPACEECLDFQEVSGPSSESADLRDRLDALNRKYLDLEKEIARLTAIVGRADKLLDAGSNLTITTDWYWEKYLEAKKAYQQARGESK